MEQDEVGIVLQSFSSDIQQLSDRMDFFESIVLRLLVGLKEAGIIVEEDEEEVIDIKEDEEGGLKPYSKIILT